MALEHQLGVRGTDHHAIHSHAGDTLESSVFMLEEDEPVAVSVSLTASDSAQVKNMFHTIDHINCFKYMMMLSATIILSLY